MRRVVLIALSLLLTVLAAGLPASAASGTFSDVPPGAPFAADIEWLSDEGIAQGGADGRFRPDAPVTRQAMAVFLYKFANPGGTAPRCAAAAYPDVPRSSLYCGSIEWLGDEGITRGTANGTFRPLGPITRQAMAAFLYHLEYGGSAPPACRSAANQDVPPSSDYCGSIAWLYAQGVTTSAPSGNFAPEEPVTRGMMAAFLHRFHLARTAPLGVDVSHPQCGRALPTERAFGIVGVNEGRPTVFNPCFGKQVTWAAASSGATSQPVVQLYVNTANPGAVTPRVASWPASGANDHGSCTGGNDQACAYEYGKARATEDLLHVGGQGLDPADHVWWLDVETGNSWDTGTTHGELRNVAVLEGMADTLRAAGVGGLGLYSTAYQWGEITGGRVAAGSPLRGLPSWLAGATGVGTAKRACAKQPLTPGGTVELVQFVEGGFDRNWSCG